MLNIGAGELAVILVLALLILGPKRLPEMARGIGKFLREFRRQTDEVRTTIETEFYRMDRDVLREEFRKNQPVVPSGPDRLGQGLKEVSVTGPLDGGRKPANELASGEGADLPPALRAAAEDAQRAKEAAGAPPAEKAPAPAAPAAEAPKPIEHPETRWEE